MGSLWIGSGSGMRHSDSCCMPLPGNKEISAFEALSENPYGQVQTTSTFDLSQKAKKQCVQTRSKRWLLNVIATCRHPFLPCTVRTNGFLLIRKLQSREAIRHDSSPLLTSCPAPFSGFQAPQPLRGSDFSHRW